MEKDLLVSGGCVKFVDAHVDLEALPLDWIGAWVAVEGCDELLEDSWSPLLVALECNASDAALGRLLTAFAHHPAFLHVAPGLAVTVKSNDETVVTDFFSPCFTLALKHKTAEKRLSTVFSGIAAELSQRRVMLPMTALVDDDGGDIPGAADLLLRWGSYVGVACATAPPAEINVRALTTQALELHYFTDIRTVALLTRFAVASHQLVDVVAPVRGHEQVPLHVTFRDVALAVRIYRGEETSDDWAAGSHHLGLILLILATTPLPASRLETLLTTQVAPREVTEPWLTAPTPQSTSWAKESRVPSGWEGEKPATRPDMLLLAMRNSRDTADEATKTVWHRFASNLAQAVFGADWASDAKSDDAADPVAFALEETRLGLQRFVAALHPVTPSESATPAAAVSLRERFDAAARAFGLVAKKHPNDVKLRFYALFKQATSGDVTGSRPWAIEMEARAKYNAWEGVKGMPRDVAMQTYVDEWLALAA